jgi:hypothetical protein
MFPVLSRAARLQALIIAGLAAASVVAQWAYLMELRGTGPLETVIQMARFFTILTMIFVVIAFFTVAISKTRGLSALTLASLTLSVVMTGAVYHVLLAEFWNPTGLGVVADIGLHTVVPVAVTLWWLFHAPKTSLAWADLPAFGLWPSVYMAYALGLASIDGDYPYPFMDPGLRGVWQVAVMLANLGVLILLGGVVMIGIGRFADR